MQSSVVSVTRGRCPNILVRQRVLTRPAHEGLKVLRTGAARAPVTHENRPQYGSVTPTQRPAISHATATATPTMAATITH